HLRFVACQLLCFWPNQSSEIVRCGLKSANPSIRCNTSGNQSHEKSKNGQWSFGCHSSRKKVPHEKACFFLPMQICSFLLFGSLFFSCLIAGLCETGSAPQAITCR